MDQHESAGAEHAVHLAQHRRPILDVLVFQNVSRVDTVEGVGLEGQILAVRDPEIGIRELLMKPVSQRVLAEAVRNCLEQDTTLDKHLHDPP